MERESIQDFNRKLYSLETEVYQVLVRNLQSCPFLEEFWRAFHRKFIIIDPREKAREIAVALARKIETERDSTSKKPWPEDARSDGTAKE